MGKANWQVRHGLSRWLWREPGQQRGSRPGARPDEGWRGLVGEKRCCQFSFSFAFGWILSFIAAAVVEDIRNTRSASFLNVSPARLSRWILRK